MKSIKAKEFIENKKYNSEDVSSNVFWLKEWAAKEAVELAEAEMRKRAIEAFKWNCQNPLDTEPCTCKLCIRMAGKDCALLNGFIAALDNPKPNRNGIRNTTKRKH